MEAFTSSLKSLDDSLNCRTETLDSIVNWLQQIEPDPVSQCSSLLAIVPEVSNPEDLLEQNDETNSTIWKYIYAHLRTNRKNQIIQLCKSTGHNWKATMLLSPLTKTADLTRLLTSSLENSPVLTTFGWLSKTFCAMRTESWKDVLYNHIHCNLGLDISKEWLQSNMAPWMRNSVLPLERVHMYLCWIIMANHLSDTPEIIEYIISLLIDALINPTFDITSLTFFFFFELDYYHRLESNGKIFKFLFALTSTFTLSSTYDVENSMEWICILSKNTRNDRPMIKLTGMFLMAVYKQRFLNIECHQYEESEILHWKDIVNAITRGTGYSMSEIIKEWTNSMMISFSTSLELLLLSLSLLESLQLHDFFIEYIFEILDLSFSTIITRSCSQERAFDINRLIIKHIMSLNSNFVLSLPCELLKLWQDYSKLCTVYACMERYSSHMQVDSFLMNSVEEILNDPSWLTGKNFRDGHLTLLKSKKALGIS